MTRTIRYSKNYRLYEGSLQARGCYYVTRLSDGASTYANTGYDGQREAAQLRRLSNPKFDEACAAMEFYADESEVL
jgi:hypothetical protein